MRRYATMRRCATLNTKFSQGTLLGNTFVFSVALRRNVAQRRIYERIFSNNIYVGINKIYM